MNAQDIRNQIQEVLSNDPNNTDKILKLTTELAKLDTDKVRFSVDAGVVDRLGKELVARHETAVSELIKNAYDADATEVNLNFINVDNIGGTLTIIDNGTGMTRQQLIDGFMRIASTDKIHNDISINFNRKRAGRKGIGRFSTQRLGDKLTIITQTSGTKKALKVTIEWNKYSIDKDLFLITNRIEEIEPNLSKVSGTTLIIDNLRESWTEATIKRVYRYALDIVQPFPLSKKKIIQGEINDPGFKINCFKDGGEPIADENSMFFQHALAEIEGFVDGNGNGYWEIVNSKVDAITKPQLIERKEQKNTFHGLSFIKFKAYYFIYKVGLIPKQVQTYINETAREQGGIRIYKNGFRVLPYAEPEDDWVGLDSSTTRRSVLATHRNINFFGFVEIDNKNNNFKELSSREGLEENLAFQELQDFVYKGLIAAANRVASARGIKTKTNQKDWKKDKPEEIVKEVVKTLNKLAEDIENVNSSEGDESFEDYKESFKQRSEEFKEKAKRLEETFQKIKEELDELSMLRILAGLGLIIGEFTHEIMKYMAAFDVDAQYLIDNLDKSLEEYKRAIRLQETFKSFQVYASYFDNSISQNVNRELEIINIKQIVKEFKSTLENDLLRNNIELDLQFENDEIYTTKMHTSEWASILFNLYSNAKKAIKRKNPLLRKLKIRAGIDKESVFCQFMDNGDGIPIEDQERIFNAFFTTSSPKGHRSNSINEMSGTGLGLKIVNDIINGYNGEIFIDNPENDYTTNFRIEIPKATEKEIDELWDID